jgi:hypothetical protein
VNLHGNAERNFQRRFCVKLWYGILHSQLTGVFTLVGRLTGEIYRQFLHNGLPHPLVDLPLKKRLRLYLQHDGTHPGFGHAAKNVFRSSSPWFMEWSWWSQHWPPSLNVLDLHLWGHMTDLEYQHEAVTEVTYFPWCLDGATRVRGNLKEVV